MKLEVEKQGLTKEELLVAAFSDIHNIFKLIDCYYYRFDKKDVARVLKVIKLAKYIIKKISEANFYYKDDENRRTLLQLMTLLNNKCYFLNEEIDRVIKNNECHLDTAREEIKNLENELNNANKIKMGYVQLNIKMKDLIKQYTEKSS